MSQPSSGADIDLRVAKVFDELINRCRINWEGEVRRVIRIVVLHTAWTSNPNVRDGMTLAVNAPERDSEPSAGAIGLKCAQFELTLIADRARKPEELSRQFSKHLVAGVTVGNPREPPITAPRLHFEDIFIAPDDLKLKHDSAGCLCVNVITFRQVCVRSYSCETSLHIDPKANILTNGFFNTIGAMS